MVAEETRDLSAAHERSTDQLMEDVEEPNLPGSSTDENLADQPMYEMDFIDEEIIYIQ